MIPLADRMRPQKLAQVVGQQHLAGEGKILQKVIQNKQPFSLIFWGPPGVGKTTLARVIALELESEFYEFSAVSTGIVEIKKLIEEIRGQKKEKSPILFIDEIHRFSKAQQDALLPHVERGTVIFIGATTENPSFEVISPLLSRTRVLTLKPLEKSELEELTKRALEDKEKGLGKFRVKLEEEALDFLLEVSGGDARQVLNTLEIAVNLACHPRGGGIKHVVVINKVNIEEAVQKKALSYDKHGDEHYNTISAFIKSMRASNTDAALYYLARMVEAGEDPLFIARRMVVFASEDVASPTALVVANAVFQACQQVGLPECQENLAAGVVYLSQAKKDRSAYEAYMKALEDVRKYGSLPIPMNLRNPSTKLMKSLGYGENYQKYTKEDLMPEKLKCRRYH